jgi:hypothetical protein
VLSDIGGQAALTNPITGTGTTNFLPKFTGGSTLGNSQIFDNGTNVGIGTTSPVLKFDVVSTSQYDGIRTYNTSSTQGADIRVGNDANNNLGFLRVGGSALGNANANTLMVGTGGGYDIHIAPNGTPAITAKNGGNVGIGTTSPASRFEVVDGNGSVFRAIANGTNIIEIGNFKTIGSGGFGYQQLDIASSIITFNTGTAGGGSASERMRITTGGDMLLGETSTVYSSKFTVSYNPSNSNGPIILDNRSLFAASVGGAQWFGGRFNSSNNYRPFGGIGAFKENSTDGNSLGYVSIFTNSNAADTTEKMRITSSGNVGIGTTSPSARLDVVGSAGIRVNEDGSGTKVLTIRSDWAGVDPAINVTTSNSLLLMTANTERMRITSGGNVGIGTTSPSERLTVSGNVVATAFFTSSDITLKNIIKTNYNPTGIEAISYKWKDSGIDTKVHVGYSAQQVQEFMPDAVSKDSNGKLSVNYVEVLVAKIASLEAEVKLLKAN